MIAPGPKLEALKDVEKLVKEHLDGTSGLDVEQVVGRISERLASVATMKLDVEQVEERLARMEAYVHEGDYERAHGLEVSLYREVLAQCASEGSDLASRALRAEQIVTRWT